MENTNTTAARQEPPEEPESLVGDALASLDCLFTLHCTGDGFDGLLDSTVNTMLGNAVTKLNKAYALMTATDANAEGEKA